MDKINFRSIDDILNDPELDNILQPLNTVKKESYVDSDIKSLKEIEEWVKDNGRRPINTREDLTERSMFHRLKGLKNKYDKLKDYDDLNLLGSNEETSNNISQKLKKEVEDDLKGNKISTLDDILNDDSALFDGIDDDSTSKLFDTEFYHRRQAELPEVKAKRHKMSDFYEYSVMFKQVQKELSSGQRQLVPFKNYEILLHHFYVLKNQLIYIESFGDEEEKNNENGKYIDRRVHVIYENGTESNVLYRGLGSSLYGRGGKIVTEITDDIELNSEDYQTGYIYVLKSLSNDLRITSIDPLYKVGFTSGSVKKRIANAENEPTYLYAPVKEIEEFQIINIKAESLETAIHHALQNYRLDMDIRLSNGNLVSPREWFNIDLETIENIISEIVAKLQMNQ
ncbi:uncharacterized protein RZ56_12430 [Apilactobacillus kunkeei]|nr:uncharacterized protein RZ56_12430 [Apilactobacillus kunkeei]